MKDSQQRAAAKEFAEYWNGKGYEKGESQAFWLSLLRDVYGVEHPEQYIFFEDQVHLDHTSFIDGNIPATHVLIEQKGLGKDLRKAIKQSDGSMLTPFQQAKRYAAELPYSQRPRWIVTCNFSQFLVYDMEKPSGEPEEILLENLEDEYYRLQFLIDTADENIKKEMEVSIQAGNLVGVIYDEFLKQYKNPDAPHSLQSLNMLCVRLVFCLYAEDSGIFGGHSKFHNYLKSFSAKDMRRALIDLFEVLDTLPEDRDPYMDEQLAAFPYVNGGLFADENIEIPLITDKIVDILLTKASEDFNWSDISPTIFGAVFESTLNPETRRSGGMHYTSIENIHKVIDPLFLNELKEELEEICSIKVDKTRIDKLEQFRTKLASLTFLDPACGSGNFLTETYISLRRLENEALKAIIAAQKGQVEGQIILGAGSTIVDPIKVSIGQFYGIEINDFAVTVAKTALWIAESQMMKETEDVVHMNLDFLPLKSYANIVEDNALRIDWETVVPKEKLNYIMGNPPFVGKKEQTKEQKADLLSIFGKNISGAGNLDYVTAWYVKAADIMNSTNIRAAFVSTNSITQGEQPSALWTKLKEFNTSIIFAYRSFDWASESSDTAAVYCVIIGFITISFDSFKKKIFEGNRFTIVDNINPYLLDAPIVMISSRSKPLCNVPPMCYGSMPIDNNHLILNETDVQILLNENPNNSQLIREYVGGDELLKGTKRWCLWLKDIEPEKYINSKFVMKRIEDNRNYRLYESNRPQTNKAADTPHLFGEIRQPENGALVIPKVSSEDRRYIPISYVEPNVIINGSALMIPNATLYHFGILSSNVHNSWMRVVAGRLELRYQYSASIVYNNFPWPNPTEAQKEEIENAAKEVLKCRRKHSLTSLAKMYAGSKFLVFTDLKSAHDNLNRAVMKAYGFGKEQNSESSCVAELMKMYQEMTKSKKWARHKILCKKTLDSRRKKADLMWLE